MFQNNVKLFKYKTLFISDLLFILYQQGHNFRSQTLLSVHFLHDKVQRMNGQGKRSMKISFIQK